MFVFVNVRSWVCACHRRLCASLLLSSMHCCCCCYYCIAGSAPEARRLSLLPSGPSGWLRKPKLSLKQSSRLRWHGCQQQASGNVLCRALNRTVLPAHLCCCITSGLVEKPFPHMWHLPQSAGCEPYPCSVIVQAARPAWLWLPRLRHLADLTTPACRCHL